MRVHLSSRWRWIGAWLTAAATIPLCILLPADLTIWIVPVLIVPLVCLIDARAQRKGFAPMSFDRL